MSVLRRWGLATVAVLVVASGLLVAAGPARAASTPAIEYVDFAGRGGGDLLGVLASGFTPAGTVGASLAGDAASYPLADLTADARGWVQNPAGYRVPLDLPIGSYRLVLTDTSGATAQSEWIRVVAPGLRSGSGPPGVSAVLSLTGVAGGTDAVRTLSFGAAPLEFRFQESAQSTAVSIVFAVPATTRPGTYPVHYTQDRQPALALDATYVVTGPSLTVTPVGIARLDQLGNRNAIDVDVAGLGPQADASVTVTDAARRTTVLRALGSTGGQFRMSLPGVAPGRGVIAVTDRVSGAAASVPVTVDPVSVTGPLNSGAQLQSPDGNTQFRMGIDGNLVLYRQSVPRWTSATSGRPGAHLVPQADGSWVVVTAGARPSVLWTAPSRTTDRPTRLTVQDDGNLVVYSAHGTPLWWTRTRGGDGNPMTLAAGSSLGPGGRIQTMYGSYLFTMQTDGNLTLYYTVQRGTPVRWQTGTGHHGGARLTLQGDGNLVVYDAAGRALWANGVRNTPGARVVMQDDGNVVEYSAAGRPVWATNTKRP